MFKTIKKLILLCGIMLLSSVPSFAFLNGGYVDGLTPADCYITFSGMSVSSNTVNVDTIQITSIISDRIYVSTNMTGIPVSVSVTNTGINPVNFNLSIRIYPDTLGSTSLNIGYTIAPLTRLCNIAAGATTTYSFTVDASAGIDKTYPVIVDGFASAVGFTPPFGNDGWWTAIDGTAVSGAVTPWIFDTRDAPNPISVIATPSSLAMGTVTINVTFNRTMNVAVPLVVQAISQNGSVIVAYTGGWVSGLVWSGTLNVPLAWSTGWYGVSINGGIDTLGIPMALYLENTNNPIRGSFQVTRNVPVPILVTVNPNPAGTGTITLNVQFDQQMSTNVAAVFEAWLGGVLIDTWDGGWLAAPTNTWVGTLNATTLPEGIYTLVGNSAMSMTGLTMVASANLGSFEIDRSPPTVNLYHAATGNAGAPFPVTLVAVDSDIIPLAPVLWAQFQLMDGSVLNVQVIGWASVGGVTWSGVVMIPINASPNTVATFNNLMVTDNAGLTSNVINSGATFNIGTGMPFITNITFDNAPVIDWDYIGTTPVIRFLVVDGANSGAISPNTVRVTMNGVLLVSGDLLNFVQVGTTPNVYQLTYQIIVPLTPGNYHFEFGASDVSGNAALPILLILRVTNSAHPDLVREPFNGPNPFSPNGDGVDDVTYICYELNRAAPVRIYIFNMDGEIMWRKDIEEGDEGAHAGYNSVMWEGETSMGDALPNGVYIGHIIVKDDGEKKSLGRVRIVILK